MRASTSHDSTDRNQQLRTTENENAKSTERRALSGSSDEHCREAQGAVSGDLVSPYLELLFSLPVPRFLTPQSLWQLLDTRHSRAEQPHRALPTWQAVLPSSLRVSPSPPTPTRLTENRPCHCSPDTPRLPHALPRSLTQTIASFRLPYASTRLRPSAAPNNLLSLLESHSLRTALLPLSFAFSALATFSLSLRLSLQSHSHATLASPTRYSHPALHASPTSHPDGYIITPSLTSNPTIFIPRQQPSLLLPPLLIILHSTSHKIIKMGLTDAQDVARVDSKQAAAIASNVEDYDALVHDAAEATQAQEQMSLAKAIKTYPNAIMFSLILSLAVIMEGYDTLLIGNFFAMPAFARKYGVCNAEGKCEIPAPWQSGLTNGSQVGSIIGLQLTGIASERYGYRRTILVALAFMTAFIFIPFFAPNLTVLLIGQILQGLPWVASRLSPPPTPPKSPLSLFAPSSPPGSTDAGSSASSSLPVSCVAPSTAPTTGPTRFLTPSSGSGPSPSSSDAGSLPSRPGGWFARTASRTPSTLFVALLPTTASSPTTRLTRPFR